MKKLILCATILFSGLTFAQDNGYFFGGFESNSQFLIFQRFLQGHCHSGNTMLGYDRNFHLKKVVGLCCTICYDSFYGLVKLFFTIVNRHYSRLDLSSPILIQITSLIN